jgi:hypothetical protein
VEDYHKEIQITIIWANIVDDRKATMTRFFNEVNGDIANIVELQHYVELENMAHMKTKVERKVKRMGSSQLQFRLRGQI